MCQDEGIVPRVSEIECEERKTERVNEESWQMSRGTDDVETNMRKVF